MQCQPGKADVRLFRSSELVQHPGTRIDDPPSALPTRFGRLLLTLFQVFEICLAGWATDELYVEADVIDQVVVEGLQKVAAELIPRWA